MAQAELSNLIAAAGEGLRVLLIDLARPEGFEAMHDV
jgi:hypothetical protein